MNIFIILRRGIHHGESRCNRAHSQKKPGVKLKKPFAKSPMPGTRWKFTRHMFLAMKNASSY